MTRAASTKVSAAASLFTFACVAFVAVGAYNIGDPVPIMMRTSMNDLSSQYWRDAKTATAPTFAVNTEAEIVPEYQKRPLSLENRYGMAFSFAQHKFETEFVEITNGRGDFVREIRFDIGHTDKDVVTMRHRAIYFDAPPSSPPEKIRVRYYWHELPYEDPEYAIHMILVCGLVTALLGCVASFMSLPADQTHDK